MPLLVLFVVLDLGYTGWQNYRMPLEWDMPTIVLPIAACRPVLSDPFGWAALTRHEVSMGPNRFFAHISMVGYFKSVPFWLQTFLSPLDSVYAACGLFSALVQALLLYVLAMYASGSGRPGWRFWVLAALLTPLFQSAGYNGQMGIIDNSITYTFFYAYPLALLGLFYWPFYRAARHGEPLRLRWWQYALLLGLAVVLSFNGAIIPGVVAVLNAGICLWWLGRQAGAWRRGAAMARVPWPAFSLLGLIGLLCLYSLYIGRFELESEAALVSVAERYRLLPAGLNETLFRRPALPMLLGATLLNLLLAGRSRPATAQDRWLRKAALGLGIFALAYVLLLPLGGYRHYRPLIVRHDSIMPVLLGLMTLYAATTYQLAGRLPGRSRRWYLGWTGALALFYTLSDNAWTYADNSCQRQAIETLARATAPIVRLEETCPVLAWNALTDYHETYAQAAMLQYWGITKGFHLYYQPNAAQ
ncbi:hypothetical protein D0T11_14560 [Hymenobacter rubripertinctus]|uniref:Glycosyltransferase RgtA/B/C/D-like domain-containing protein n=1 Tax=Hymenobacter rubripertinctus TaxID=2029981 RepID=A0A418QT07_9BACT|nr:hypothetical protein D0T11_14560 [Hymenobacter rubripertinctus]